MQSYIQWILKLAFHLLQEYSARAPLCERNLVPWIFGHLSLRGQRGAHFLFFMRRGTFSDCGMMNVGVIDRVCARARVCLVTLKSPWLMALFLEKKKKTTLASTSVVHAAYAHTNTAERIGKCQHIFPKVNNVLLATANFFVWTRLCCTAILCGAAFDLLREKAATLYPKAGKTFSWLILWTGRCTKRLKLR